MTVAFELDFGSGKPMIARNGSGEVLFDADYAGLRLYGYFTGTVPANSFYATARTDGTTGFTYTPFGKTFGKAPYTIAQLYLPSPFFLWRNFVTQLDTGKFLGAFTVAVTDGLYVANLSPLSSAQYAVAVFENGIDG